MKEKESKKQRKNNFGIDFFELLFLTEACVPKMPIARTMFFQRVIDSIYYELDDQQREQMLDVVNRRIDKSNEDEELVMLFLARYDSTNVYDIEVEYDGKKETIKEAFLYEGKYYTSRNRYINEDVITKVI